ncbi:Peptide chain release factor N(5)-glutamine methyltransferase [hydrothermal vent metagenome]|uniref:peptide chain release factor N(5)-glutamine methyltransferase n=1 Tax=hydrothermal vent metagenome TaxID=652676 RepID=A0A3B0XEL2_9ZZZZ
MPKNLNIESLLKTASESLKKTSESPLLDAQVLLAYCLQKNRTWLITWADKAINENNIARFNALIKRRESGEPIAHITGTREFWSLDLNVTKDTLIPRPDTELMVETILQQYPQNTNLNLLDLGTGSGAIALALASERPSWQITATDKSTAALDIAKQNAQQLKLSNIRFVCGSWFEPLANQQFDIIASNPPYIPQSDPHLLQGDVRFEPVSALASGADGLDDIRLISQQAAAYLNKKGMLIIEHGFDQKTEIRHIFQDLGYKNIQQYTDLSHNPRLCSGLIN